MIERAKIWEPGIFQNRNSYRTRGAIAMYWRRPRVIIGHPTADDSWLHFIQLNLQSERKDLQSENMAKLTS